MTEAAASRESARVAVFDGEGRLLLLRRSSVAAGHHPVWELPGEELEPGEGPADAARRGLRRQAGIDVEPLGRRIGVVETDFVRDGRRFRQRETIFLLRASAPPRCLPVGEPRRLAAQRWWPRAEALPRVCVRPAQLRRLLREVR